MKIETERIDTSKITQRLSQFCHEFTNHGFFKFVQKNQLPISILKEFAFYQYSDSILWIPMLSQMKSKAVRSIRLKRAIEDNIRCEAGIGGISHITMAKDFMRSLQIKNIDEFPTETFARSASLWLSDEFEKFSEPEVAGWLLVAETLVPIMFLKMKEAYRHLPESSLQYFEEHIDVDSEQHSAWMMEAVEDVVKIYGKESINQILDGMMDAFEETKEIPNLLFRKVA